MPGFLHQAPDDIRGELAALGYQSFGDMGKAHLDLYRNAGKGRVLLPGDKATDQEYEAFHHAIGVPKDAKDYGDWTFDNVTPDAGMVKFAQDVFPKAGVTKRGAEILTRGWNKLMSETVANAEKAAAAKVQEGEEAFAKEQGSKHAASIDLANRAATHFGLTPEQVGVMKGSLGVGQTYKLLLGIANAVASDGEQPTGGQSTFSIQTKEGAKAELDRMNADPAIGAILRDANHREHKTLKAKWERLSDMVSGINTSSR